MASGQIEGGVAISLFRLIHNFKLSMYFDEKKIILHEMQAELEW